MRLSFPQDGTLKLAALRYKIKRKKITSRKGGERKKTEKDRRKSKKEENGKEKVREFQVFIFIFKEKNM